MQPGRIGMATILLLGWLCLTPLSALLAQESAGPKSLPVILEFDRKFCPICKASENVILAVKDQYPGQFVVRKLYMDEEEKLFRRYKVAIVPTQVFLDPSGKEVNRHEGVFEQAALIQKLREWKFIRD
jgi:thioredoxin 1